MAKKAHPFIPTSKLDKLDRFIAYATGEEDSLSPEEQEEFLILSLVDDQLRLARSWQKIARIVEIKTQRRWSKATTFRWITYTKYVFGSTKFVDKNYIRHQAIEWYEKAINMALQAKDYWFLGKQLKQYIEIAGLNEIEGAEDSKFVPHQYILNIINQVGNPTQIDLTNPNNLAQEDRRSLALKVQHSSLPENLLDAINLQPPEPSDSLDDE